MFPFSWMQRRRVEQIWQDAHLQALEAKAAAFDAMVQIHLAEQITARQIYRAVEPRSSLDSWRWSS